MKGWGIFFTLLGIAYFIIPGMNLGFTLISLFGAGKEALTGGVFIAIGLILLVLGIVRPARGR